ncbi:hypothetical protein V6N13_110912 [Hibiscus sabdariffa]
MMLWNDFRNVEAQVKVRELEAVPGVHGSTYEPVANNGSASMSVARECELEPNTSGHECEPESNASRHECELESGSAANIPEPIPETNISVVFYQRPN